MRKLLALIVLCGPALAIEVPAGLTTSNVDRLDPPTMTVEQAASQIGRPGARAPQNVSGEGASDGAFLLGAANTGGLFGSFFTTDVFLMNPTPTSIVKLNIFALRPNVNNQATAPPS